MIPHFYTLYIPTFPTYSGLKRLGCDGWEEGVYMPYNVKGLGSLGSRSSNYASTQGFSADPNPFLLVSGWDYR